MPQFVDVSQEHDPRSRAERPIRELLLEAARLLKAHHVKIGNFSIPMPVRRSSTNDAFRRLCGRFESAGTQVGMEIYMPDPNAQTLVQALDWVRGADNGGLFLDTWHVENMEGITHADVASLDANDIVGVELSDGLVIEPRHGLCGLFRRVPKLSPEQAANMQTNSRRR